jgi:protease-4
MKKIMISLLFLFTLLMAQYPGTGNPASGDLFLNGPGNNPAVYGVNTGTSLTAILHQGNDNSIMSALDVQLNSAHYLLGYDSTFFYRGGMGLPLLRHVWAGLEFNSVDKKFSAGLLIRPATFLSLGAVVHDVTGPDQLTAGIAIRPFNDRITFGYTYQSPINASFKMTGHNSIYFVETEVRDGILLGYSYDDVKQTSLISLGVNLTNQSARIWNDKQSTTVAVSQHTRYLRNISKGKPGVYLRLNGQYAREIVPGMTNVTNINDLLSALEAFKHDHSVSILYLDIRSFSMNISEMTELQASLTDLKESGKRIYAYSINGNTATWFLTAPAHKRMIYPLGEYRLSGLSSTNLYMRSLLDTLGIDVEIQRIGDYKSAPEPLLLNAMSGPGKESLREYLDSIMSGFISGISNGTGLDETVVSTVIKEGPYLVKEALEKGIVHELAYPDEIKGKIAKHENVKSIDWRSIWSYSPTKGWPYTWKSAETVSPVAVIYASGAITEGKSRYSPLSGQITMGDRTISDRLKTAQKDPRIKAIVLRVDSPGGSIIASDRIHREISRITKPKDKNKAKPVIVSMGNLAASGGYYISVPADKIFTEENTLTGSIGIYGGSFTFEKFLRQTLLIHPDSLYSYKNSMFNNPFFMMTDEERAWQMRSLQNGYEMFVGKVMDGRNMSFEEVDSLGRGRIWSGEAAFKHGLVDTVGTLKDAIHYAAKISGVPVQYTTDRAYPADGFGMMNLPLKSRMVQSVLADYPAIQKAGKIIEKELLWKENDMMIILPWNILEFEYISGGEGWQP